MAFNINFNQRCNSNSINQSLSFSFKKRKSPNIYQNSAALKNIRASIADIPKKEEIGLDPITITQKTQIVSRKEEQGLRGRSIKEKSGKAEALCNAAATPSPGFDKVVIVEIFSSFNEEKVQSEAMRNELVGNFESSINLAKKYGQTERYIWSINPKVTKEAIYCANEYGDCRATINLGDNLEEDADCPLKLTEKSKVIIVAQGNPKDRKIADLNAEEFIEMLHEDLGIGDLAEMELVVCKAGRDDEYMQQLKNFFDKRATNIVSYKSAIAVDRSGELIAFDDEWQVIEKIETIKVILSHTI